MFAKRVKMESDEDRFSPRRYSRRVLQTFLFEINAHPGYSTSLRPPSPLPPSVSTRNSFFYRASLPFLRRLCPLRALSGLFEHVPGRISHQTERFSPQITLVLALFDSLLLLEFSLLLFRSTSISPFSRSLAKKKRWTRLSPRERTSVSKG